MYIHIISPPVCSLIIAWNRRCEEEGRVKNVRVIIEGTAKEIAELLPNLTQAEVQLETENINSNNQEMQMLQNLVKAMVEYAASHSEEQQAAEK
jgi:Zn-dependent oligopeptidase